MPENIIQIDQNLLETRLDRLITEKMTQILNAMLDAEADDVDLRFYYPERTNYFIDAMCIPTCCQNKELAEIFINYMLSAEPAIANAEYNYYASPNSLVYEDEGYQDDLGEEAMEILYPEIEDFSALYNEYAYRNLDSDMLDFVNTLWETLKIS